ncbi:PAS domain S-box protein [Peredibacter sp. HCB2-198]|uniref:sensor histidine kinase n=1 Tax=Peredibacter sp. HCB2-198 TaxID=3383025 RepID=UPI0038B5DB84
MSNKFLNTSSFESSESVLPLHDSVSPALAEEKFRLLVESVRDYGIFLIDKQGFIESWNIGAQRIKGYSADEAIGKHFSIFYTSEDKIRRHPQYELEIAEKVGKYEEEGWRVRKDGTKFWSHIVITALRDKRGELVGFAKVTRDLTERKNAEEQLKLSEERARKMFESVKDYAMITLNCDGTVATWNEGARRIKGYEAKEIVGKHFSLFYPDQDIQMGKCEYELKEAIETGRLEDEGWRIRKDGTRFWASVAITAIRDNDGTVIAFSQVTRDMTDRKRADDLLKMSYSNLEKRIDERTNQLMSTNIKLQDAIQVRDEFLSIASHELRTPLTPLKLQIQRLLKNIQNKSLSNMSEKSLEKIMSSCDTSISRLSSLIDNLLDVSRINMGKLNLNVETFDLKEMALELIERHKLEISNSDTEVTIIAKDPIWGSFDRLRVEQVFTNLLTNALKYGNRKPVRIEVYEEMGWVHLSFHDRGLGIAPNDLERVFERFERLHAEDTVGGLGLGLYITRQIIEAHGGTIKADSSKEWGTVFQVKMPLNFKGQGL